MQHNPVPLIGAKRAGFRYNRRDIQFNEPFEAVNESDARVLILAKLAKAPPEMPGRASTAAAGDDRSRTAERDAGIPTTPRAMAEKLDRELAPGAPPVPEPEPVTLKDRGSVSFEAPPGGKPKKKRVRSKPKAKAPESAPNP